MWNMINYWTYAIFVTIPLAIVSALALVGCWSITPDEVECQITDAGRRLVRARSLLAFSCGLIVAYLFVLFWFEGAADESQPFRWCDEHRGVLPLIFTASAALLFTTLVLALKGKGEGRRAIVIAAAVIAALLLTAAYSLLDFLRYY
jgi:hypothetical protein